MKVAKCGNASCTSGNIISTVDSAVNVGWYTSIAIGSDSLPIISYYDATNKDLKVLKCSTQSCFQFNDVQPGYWAYDYVYAIYNAGITSGCGGGNFCPEDIVTRAQMAVFILKALGEPPADTCTGTVFNDVNASTVGDGFCKYIEKFSTLGITGGCGGGNYCAFDNVSRAQMAVFITKALGEVPSSTCTGTFNDVNAGTVGDTFCRYIEKFATLGITSGCGGGNYCPYSPVTRAQMAVFLSKAFLGM